MIKEFNWFVLRKVFAILFSLFIFPQFSNAQEVKGFEYFFYPISWFLNLSWAICVYFFLDYRKDQLFESTNFFHIIITMGILIFTVLIYCLLFDSDGELVNQWIFLIISVFIYFIIFFKYFRVLIRRYQNTRIRNKNYLEMSTS